MQFECVAISGPHAGNTVRFSTFRPVVVGRREGDCDYDFPFDPEMSGRHFSLEARHEVVVLRDLDSTNGTLMHGERISEVCLKPGDEFRAGRSVFSLQHADRGGTVKTDSAATSDSATEAPTDDFKRWQRHRCPSGIYAFESSTPWERVVVPLESALYVLNLPDYEARYAVPAPVWVFDWFEPGVIETLSPAVITAADLETQRGLKAEAAGDGGIFAVIGGVSIDQFRHNLSMYSQGKSAEKGRANPQVGLARQPFERWCEHLRSCDAAFAAAVFARGYDFIFPRDEGTKTCVLTRSDCLDDVLQ